MTEVSSEVGNGIAGAADRAGSGHFAIDFEAGRLRGRVEAGRMHLVGEVDMSTHELLAAICAAARPEGQVLVCDLSEVEFIDVGGTRELVTLARRLGPEARVAIVEPPQQLRAVLKALSWEEEVDLPNDEVRL